MIKKIVCALFLIGIQGQLFAQFNPSDYGKSFDCTIIFKSGETKKLYAKYSHPGILMGPKNPLETNIEGNIDKSLIETFYMNNQCWVERSTPVGRQWVILNRQGAIEHITYITSGVTTSNATATNTTVVTGDLITKNGQSETNSSMIMGYKKKMSSFVSDYPELATKVTNGEKGYGFITYLNVVDEYNAWYEKTNPGKIKHYPWFSGGKSSPSSITDVNQAIQESKDSVANARMALLATRPTTAAPEIASKKPNIPPKKEAFTAKVKRYEAEGHKIAVVMQEEKTKIIATIGATTAEPKSVGFNDKPESDFIEEGVLEKTVSELNRIYKTTIFVSVPLSQIPLADVKSVQVDDWWSTCYKTVVYLSNLRQYNCSNDVMTDGDFQGTASIGLYANVFEYVDDGKHGTDILKRLYVLGYGNSDSFKYTQSEWPITFAWMEAKVDWIKVRQRYDKKKQDQFAKLAEKWD